LLSFQADTGTNTNVIKTMTTAFFRANQAEDDGGAYLSYRTGATKHKEQDFKKFHKHRQMIMIVV
jgi:hypothetical protein